MYVNVRTGSAGKRRKRMDGEIKRGNCHKAAVSPPHGQGVSGQTQPHPKAQCGLPSWSSSAQRHSGGGFTMRGADSYLDKGSSWSSGKEPAFRRRKLEFNPWVQKIPRPEEEMHIHSGMLAWRIPKDRGAWQATVHGVTKSRT